MEYHYLNSLGISEASLLSKSFLPHIPPNQLTNGLAYELFEFSKKQSSDPASEVAHYLSLLLDIDINEISVGALKTKLYRVTKTKKSKGGKGQKSFLDETFSVPVATSVIKPTEEEKSVIFDLASDLGETQKMLEKTQTKERKLKSERKALKRKLHSSDKKRVKFQKLKTQLRDSQIKIKDLGKKGNSYDALKKANNYLTNKNDDLMKELGKLRLKMAKQDCTIRSKEKFIKMLKDSSESKKNLLMKVLKKLKN
ncbi:hypothetical protein KUTeg_014720 [Tegillarca granosa]|uniref:Uncharacterized protein n=1 Tax=Tegillarca granosa TaxID=220873 RepID=A0ABQ9EWI5_TEGGR|nr:hypothetical protein KUTeg_014720 [Tegillarca granosa]